MPLTAISMSQLKPHEIAAGTGMTNFLRNIGGSVGTAISTTMWGDYANRYHAQMVEHINNGNLPYQDFSNIANQAGLKDGSVLMLIDRLINSEAYLLSTSHVMLMAGLVLLLLAPVIWLARPPFTSSKGAH